MVRTALAFSAALTASCASVPVYVVDQSADAGPAPAALLQALRLSRSGVVYDRVRGAALRRAIVGSAMSDDPAGDAVVVAGAQPLHFRPDGTYFQVFNGRLRTVDRGTYRVNHDWVCLYPTIGRRSHCFGLFKAPRKKPYLAVYSEPYAPLRSVIIVRGKARGVAE